MMFVEIYASKQIFNSLPTRKQGGGGQVKKPIKVQIKFEVSNCWQTNKCRSDALGSLSLLTPQGISSASPVTLGHFLC